MKDRKLLTIGIAGVFCGLIAAILFLKLLKREPAPEPLPDFESYTNVKEKKEAFFSYILPFVEEENRDILAERERIEKLHSRFSRGKRISRRNRKWLNKIGEEYDLASVEKPTEEFLSQLLERVDVIPPSLALAQAANESGWGTSRFAKEGRNLFGIWCYTPGCGIVPRRRVSGATHEVKSYESVGGCVEDYISNLNSNAAYSQLRSIRAGLRSEGEKISGQRLDNGLVKYSSRGYAYVSDIQSMIRVNKLQNLD